MDETALAEAEVDALAREAEVARDARIVPAQGLDPLACKMFGASRDGLCRNGGDGR